MRQGEHRRLAASYDGLVKELVAQVQEINRAKRKALEKLQAECLTEHGAHEDDGSMFFGFCARCGVCLG